MKIKSIFPGSFYARRKIKIYDNDKYIGDLYPNETIEINPKTKKLKFKLDYHKAIVENPENHYFIVYFDYRPYFPFNWLDLMKNALKVEQVETEDLFEKRITELSKSSAKKININVFTHLIIILQALAGLSILFTSVFKKDLIKSDINLLFFIGLVSFVSVLILWLNLKNTYQGDFKIRHIAAIFLFLIVSFYTTSFLRILLTIISVLLFLLFLGKEFHLTKQKIKFT